MQVEEEVVVEWDNQYISLYASAVTFRPRRLAFLQVDIECHGRLRKAGKQVVKCYVTTPDLTPLTSLLTPRWTLPLIRACAAEELGGCGP